MPPARSPRPTARAAQDARRAEPARLTAPLALLALGLGLGLALCGCAGARPPPDRPAEEPLVAVERRAAEEGRDADRAMAAAVASGDAEAFALHVAVDGIFFGGGGPAPGRAAVSAAWAPFFAPDGPRLAWAPERALASPAGDLVFTWGRFTFTPAVGGPPEDGRYLTAWRRDADGLLRAVLDGADEPLPPLPPSAARRPLRAHASGDGTLRAEGGLLLEDGREAGWYLRLERVGPGGAELLGEGGLWRPAAP